ncbi:MAG: hypothetical protein DHS20C16_06490 [Phycisphaerae bacterium]|nr:MAG: hypothetical protein DHS20C16_06490 [Phycisphaerae bacterium]
MELLQKTINDDSFVLGLPASSFDDILSQAVEVAVRNGKIDASQQAAVEESLLQRESSASTAIGRGVAVPHAYLDTLTEPVIVFLRLAHPLNFGAPDGIPTRFVFVLIGPKGAAEVHLDTLATIARVMSDDEFRYEIDAARSKDDLLRALDDFIRRTSAPVVEAAAVPDALVSTGRLCGGIVNDLKRRLPQYAADFRDGLNARTISAIVFLFFACLAPAITFGGIMGKETGGDIGVVEMLISTAVCGLLYAFIAGHPLIILGGIGPLLIFTAILARLCNDQNLPFLPTYAWVGFWTSLLLIILAVTDASALMRFFTRFTDEIFAALMSMLFIYESLRAIFGMFNESFSGDNSDHDVAFFSLILALGTFYIATNLSRFRRSRYLQPKMREFLADFGPAIALASMAGVALLLGDQIELPSLNAPEKFGTTNERPWIVNPFEGPMWSWFAAIGPAILATVLIFLSHNITGRLLNNPDNKLQRGAAYHWDLAVVGLLVGVCSIFGWPWLVAATVRSLAHLRSLATVEEVVSPGGDRQERVLHVNENRITGIVVHFLIGMSLLLLPVLKMIPMAVLYGVFLFMGVVSLAGNQFFERLTLLFMDSSLYPKMHYVRRVPVKIMHTYTGFQTACLAVLSVVSLIPIQGLRLLFPLFIALLVPLRSLASRYFKPEHLAALDADETPAEEETHWAG